MTYKKVMTGAADALRHSYTLLQLDFSSGRRHVVFFFFFTLTCVWVLVIRLLNVHVFEQRNELNIGFYKGVA